MKFSICRRGCCATVGNPETRQETKRTKMKRRGSRNGRFQVYNSCEYILQLGSKTRAQSPWIAKIKRSTVYRLTRG